MYDPRGIYTYGKIMNDTFEPVQWETRSQKERRYVFIIVKDGVAQQLS